MPPLQRGGKTQTAPVAPSSKTGKVEIDPKFLNTPLNGDLVTKKLGTLGLEWDAHRAELKHALDAYTNAALVLEETTDPIEEQQDTETAQAMNEIELSVREVLDKLAEIEMRKKQLKQLKDRFSAGQVVQKPIEQYQEGVQDEIQAYTQKTARAKYGKSEEYESFHKSVWGVHHDAGHDAPSVKTYLKAEAGDADDEDDDLEVTSASRNLNDPITMAPLRIPVKHDGCQHHMEKDSATEYLRQGKGRIACPVSGCSAVWTTFVVDEALRKQIERDEQRKARAGGTQKKRKARPAVEELSD